MGIDPDLVICRTCGVERDRADLPEVCPICADERQYVLPSGQVWLTGAEVEAWPAEIELVEREPDLWGVAIAGGIGIGQQGKVVVTPAGNVLVDVPAHLTDDLVERIGALGELAAIVPTHPHMYGVQSAWSAAFGDVPVWVAQDDAEWLGHRFDALHLFHGEHEVVPGVTMRQVGGHFRGSVVVHWAGADGRGVLLSGDTIAANPDGTTTVMRSYPNRIPVSAAVARRLAAEVGRWRFDRLYDNFALGIPAEADAVVAGSLDRYAAWVSGEHDDQTLPTRH